MVCYIEGVQNTVSHGERHTVGGREGYRDLLSMELTLSSPKEATEPPLQQQQWKFASQGSSPGPRFLLSLKHIDVSGCSHC